MSKSVSGSLICLTHLMSNICNVYIQDSFILPRSHDHHHHLLLYSVLTFCLAAESFMKPFTRCRCVVSSCSVPWLCVSLLVYLSALILKHLSHEIPGYFMHSNMWRLCLLVCLLECPLISPSIQGKTSELRG